MNNAKCFLYVVGLAVGLSAVAQAAEDQAKFNIMRMFAGDPCKKLKDPNGVYREYAKDGAVALETFCADGKRHGESVRYYPDGKLLRQEPYINGQLDGVVREYYPNGFIKAEEQYREGKLNGWQYHYHESGQLSFEQEYTEGKPKAKPQHYDEKGGTIEPDTFDASSLDAGYPFEPNPSDSRSHAGRERRQEKFDAGYEPYSPQDPESVN